MKSLTAAVAFTLFGVALFIGAPFVTAWNIREAVRNGNTNYLATVIEWPRVRETLKPSIARIALDLPDPDQSGAGKPSLWQWTKAYWGQGAVNRLVDSYVTPEGLPQLFQIQKAYRNYLSGEDDANKLSIFERMSRAWSRVKRAEFKGLTAFEIDMADKTDPARIYLGRLQLMRTGWKLTELRVKFLTPAGTKQNFADVQGAP